MIEELWQLRPDIRWSGVCFGHQIICRALGSKVEPSPGEVWELAHTKLDLTDIGEKLFQTSRHIYLHQMHQDHVVNAPSASVSELLTSDMKVHVWGSTKKTPIQGVYIRERIFTSQGHLGYDADMVRMHIKERIEKGSVKDVEAAEEAKETADFEHDGLLVAGAILRFFHGDDVDIY